MTGGKTKENRELFPANSWRRESVLSSEMVTFLGRHGCLREIKFYHPTISSPITGKSLILFPVAL